MRILALDCETGGLTPGINQIVTIGVAVMESGEVLSRQEWIVGPKRHWKSGKIERVYDVSAMEVHGASWSRIKSAPPADQVVREMHQWSKENQAKELPIVAFNAQFDFGFYSDLLFMAGQFDRGRDAFFPAWPPFIGGWHCAMLLAKDVFPGLPGYRLDNVAEHFGLSRSGEFHGALEDAILAGKVWHRLESMKRADVGSSPASSPLCGEAAP